MVTSGGSQVFGLKFIFQSHLCGSVSISVSLSALLLSEKPEDHTVTVLGISHSLPHSLNSAFGRQKVTSPVASPVAGSDGSIRRAGDHPANHLLQVHSAGPSRTTAWTSFTESPHWARIVPTSQRRTLGQRSDLRYQVPCPPL